MVSDEALKKLQEQIAAWPMTQRFVAQQLIEDYRRNREDLRAYKATGLTPEEIERSKLEIEAGCVKAIARTYGIDINRLRKLAEADKDGRLVVLPCKVGDTVWVIDNPWTWELLKKPIEAYVNGMGKFSHGLYVNVLFDTRKINGTRDYEINHIGKTIFLTREEAEKALEAMKDD